MLNGRLEALKDDITTLEVDAVVNAANSSLLGGGGVDGAIHAAGGPEILEACRELRRTHWPDGMPTGEAAVTVSGRLPCRYVIHTVGPVWRGGGAGEAALLEAAYLNSLDRAAEIGAHTLAFPAISTGIYGYPREAAAVLVHRLMRRELPKRELPEKVILVFFSRGDLEVFQKAVGGKAG